MKHYFTSVAACLLFSAGISAQSFLKNDNVFMIDAGLGIYKTESVDQQNNDKDDGDAAANMVSIGYERGLTNWLGAGAKIQLANYFTEADSGTGAEPSAASFDFMALANAHFARGERSDFLVSINAGYSRFKYSNGLTGTGSNTLSGGGLVYDLRLVSRFYFKKLPVALGFSLGYTGYSYKNLADKNNYQYNFKTSGPVFGIHFCGRKRADS